MTISLFLIGASGFVSHDWLFLYIAEDFENSKGQNKRTAPEGSPLCLLGAIEPRAYDLINTLIPKYHK